MDLRRLRGERAGPFWTLVWIRLAVWLGTAFSLLWQPFRSAPFQPFPRVYGSAQTDLLFGTFFQWDSTWFAQIAEHGYGSGRLGSPAGAPAFFPLYPLIVHAVAWVTRSTTVAGVLVSLVAGGLAAVVVAEIARPVVGEDGARLSVLLLALYPLGFVFTALYSDSLFLLLSACSFLAAQRGRPWLAGVAGGLAVATRSLGLALLPSLVYLLWGRGRPGSPRAWLRLAPLLLLPGAVAAYALYLHLELGDWLAFTHAQEQIWNRHTPSLGPLSGLWQSIEAGGHGALNLVRHLGRQNNGGEGFTQTTQIGFLNAVHLLLFVPACWLTWVAWRRLGAAFGLYSAATIVFVLSAPATGFPLFSFLRFLLADFPVFLALASLLRERPRAQLAVLCTFAALGFGAAIEFSRHGYIA